jgi:replication-associated recombination protein RarA
MPECRINLAHLVAYLSEAPKSTRSYEAYKRAEDAVKLDLTIPVPLQMRNAPTGLSEYLVHVALEYYPYKFVRSEGTRIRAGIRL